MYIHLTVYLMAGDIFHLATNPKIQMDFIDVNFIIHLYFRNVFLCGD